MDSYDAPDDRKLTEAQEAFVIHFTSSPGAIGNAAESARRAGYSEKSAREIGRQLLDKPHVRKAIDDANRQSISGTLATKAVELLKRVIEDENAPIKVRVDAAKTILDRAGIVAVAPAKPDSTGDVPEKPLSEMTIEELEEIVRCSSEEMQRASLARIGEHKMGNA